MRYCQECGAEVAPDDTFCAFCGITLQPIALQTAVQDSIDSAQTSAAEIEELRIEEAAQTEMPAPFSPETTGDMGVPASLPPEMEEPDTVLRRAPNLSFTQNTIEPEEAIESLESNEPAPQSASPQNEEQATGQIAGSNELYIATIPNVALESLAHEAGVPIEELRQDEIDFAEPIQFSSEQKVETTGEVKIEPQPETGSMAEIPAQDEITEPVPFSEQEFAAQQTIEPEISEPAPETEAKNLFDDRTLVSQPLPSEKLISDELISNPSDAAVPRATESNQSKDTPGGKSTKLKPLDDGTILNKRYEIIRRIGGGG
ncbi:MAG TPA: zinc-ribbon domain-containing protein, partial [Pyrinomonadaceae bacterium]|nr:zinc-ribbon domain-containing protein [Pyrinomonadaceae bacterium]